ncbi:hypothetical protein NDU88_006128 [Pleurodeles waltl]|uniref:Uncharacterized protein n=1 Tax=Pleurodeles waltl TaxID=8319 RepID=A0AAV7VPX9_PLEWA|nr:hypothetical protein NDU88_006128 [Pleurodeles waltl]
MTTIRLSAEQRLVTGWAGNLSRFHGSAQTSIRVPTATAWPTNSSIAPSPPTRASCGTSSRGLIKTEVE